MSLWKGVHSSLVAQLVENTCHVGDLGSSPGLGRSPEEGNSHPLQYSGLENPMDCIVQGVAESRTQLSNFHLYLTCRLAREQDPDWVGIFDKRKMSCHLLWRQRVIWQGVKLASEIWEQPPADGQQGIGDYSPLTARNWILPQLPIRGAEF